MLLLAPYGRSAAISLTLAHRSNPHTPHPFDSFLCPNKFGGGTIVKDKYPALRYKRTLIPRLRSHEINSIQLKEQYNNRNDDACFQDNELQLLYV